MRVVFFGDSICVGQFVSPHATWVTRIAGRLDALYGPGVWVNNASHSGDTTRMALEKMAFDVLSHGVDVIVVQFGMNDCNFWVTERGLPRVGPEAFAENLLEIVHRARSAGARRVLLHTNHPTPHTARIAHAQCSYQESNARYNQVIRTVAGRAAARLVDVAAAWERRISAGTALETLLLPDGIHLSRAGHDLYYETTLPEVLTAVRELVP